MKKIFLYAFVLTLLATSCTEPYALQTNTFEDAVVIEATITNEMKKQEIKLSRTYRLEENGPEFEKGAVVTVTDNMGNQYDFEEDTDKYVSVTEFQAVPNRTYRLQVITADGKSYTSLNEQLTTVTEIQSVIPTAIVKEGVRGVEISVNSYDPTGTSKYYRYEYEETSRITAPKWSDIELKLNYNTTVCGIFGVFPGFPSIEKVTKANEIGKICYKTELSNDIILTSTNNLSEDRVNFPVRFIKQSDYTIGERYSILVTQYVQSFQSFSFYNTLKKISGSGSILSQNQPGFIYGNIKSTANPNEKVIGFFDVSSVFKKRIFFNYNEIFPGEPKPKYYDECEEHMYCQNRFVDYPGVPTEGPCTSNSPVCVERLLDVAGPGRVIRELLTNKLLIYSGGFGDEYIMVKPVCGDCTKVGANLKPIFWID